jgi:hypothetical protein
MLGIIKFKKNRISEYMPKSYICKTIEEFNDGLRFQHNSYGIIYRYNSIFKKMIPIQQCYYDIKTNTYKLTSISCNEDYDFNTICKECQKNNNMYDILKLCINCIEDTCKYCNLTFNDCIC